MIDDDEIYKLIDQVHDNDDPIKLRQYVQIAENEIKGILGNNPFQFYMEDSTKEQKEKIDTIDRLLLLRWCALEEMFTYTEKEKSQLLQVNNLLFSLTKKLFHRTANLYRTSIGTGRDDSFDDDYELEGKLTTGLEYDPKTGDIGCVLHFENDAYYGSDFSYMLYVLQENVRPSPIVIRDCCKSWSSKDRPDMSDKELGFDYTELDDGDSWLPGLSSNLFKGTYFCYALYNLNMNNHVSLADIVRLNGYWIDITFDCQLMTDQRGRRYAEILQDDS